MGGPGVKDICRVHSIYAMRSSLGGNFRVLKPVNQAATRTINTIIIPMPSLAVSTSHQTSDFHQPGVFGQ